ncbi:endochitinase [Trichoderma asperellum]|uniref:chitinase n=1 Tax=Trichoderma asperellum TaxID=101201 RepID=A0A6V8R033_TRIAP|nr:endochitinase [Trichoderma asperellum]
MPIGSIPASLLPHLNVAFAYITSGFDLTTLPGISPTLYQNVGNVKSKNPNIKIIISVGGWTFTNPGASQEIFSDMESSETNRATFISNIIAWQGEYGYDGIDFDWEYPGATDRGGHADDGANYVQFLKDLRAAMTASGKDYIITLPRQAPTVLGLGFYGRKYTLADPTCWQPGCAFKFAGSPGPCTATAGILSYREIMQVIADTGATPYTDTTAGVEYMVYEGNQWLSATIFAAKIKYANELGISGLMIWAIDLDDGNLDTLTAVVGTSYQNVTAANFSLVPLDYLFPSGYVPSNSTTINYGLINIGSAAEAGETNPSNTGFGFMLIAGDSHAVSSLAKRDGEREPFVFIDCPKRSSAETEETRHTARVVCMNDDLQACFQLAERGVEGTLVQMPEDCFADSIARAISLEVAKDQYVPREMTTDRSPTSPVYDFTFDMNMKLARRDTNNTMVRIDFSNVIGYWDNLIDYPGIQSSDASNMMRRYFAPTFDNWQDQTA